MTGSAASDGRFGFVRKPMLRVGVWGRDDSRIRVFLRLADDGKRIHAMDAVAVPPRKLSAVWHFRRHENL